MSAISPTVIAIADVPSCKGTEKCLKEQKLPPIVLFSITAQLQYVILCPCIERCRCKDRGTILILHGAPGAYIFGMELAKPFIRQGYRCVVISRPGYLGSPLGTNISPPQQALTYALLLNDLYIPRYEAIIAFGAALPSTMYFGLAYVSLVKSIVLLSPGINTTSSTITYNTILSTATNSMIMSILQQAVIAPDASIRQIAAFDSTSFSYERTESVSINEIDSTFKLLWSFNSIEQQREGFLNDIKNSSDFWANLASFPFKQYKVPTIIVSATTDAIGSFLQAVQLSQLIACNRLIEVTNSGFALNLGPYTEQWQEELFKLLDRTIRRWCNTDSKSLSLDKSLSCNSPTDNTCTSNNICSPTGNTCTSSSYESHEQCWSSSDSGDCSSRNPYKSYIDYFGSTS